jgi:hypothetical protein
MDDTSPDAPQPIEIELTEEHQQLIRRLSGQFANVMTEPPSREPDSRRRFGIPVSSPLIWWRSP